MLHYRLSILIPLPAFFLGGNIVESKKSILDLLWHFQTLFGPLIGEAGDRSSRRRHGWNGNDRWPGSGGPGGPPRGGYGTGRRPIGRPTFSSGMSCPPMAGGS
uniref:Uncharacterized protein n=1 Tax=Onchocerca volvulus TaxID=6282 RepID=A0A8R1XZL9_ONCVO